MLFLFFRCLWKPPPVDLHNPWNWQTVNVWHYLFVFSKHLLFLNGRKEQTQYFYIIFRILTFFFSQQLQGTQFLTIWVNCIVSKWDDLKTFIYNIRKLSLLSHFERDINGESEVLPKLDQVFVYMIIILSSLS